MDSLKKIKVSYDVKHSSSYADYTFEEIVEDLKKQHGDKVMNIELLEENIYNGIKIEDEQLIECICEQVSFEEEDITFSFDNYDYKITKITNWDIDYDAGHDSYHGNLWFADLTIKRIQDDKTFSAKIKYRNNDNIYDCRLVYGMLIELVN